MLASASADVASLQSHHRPRARLAATQVARLVKLSSHRARPLTTHGITAMATLTMLPPPPPPSEEAVALTTKEIGMMMDGPVEEG